MIITKVASKQVNLTSMVCVSYWPTKIRSGRNNELPNRGSGDSLFPSGVAEMVFGEMPSRRNGTFEVGAMTIDREVITQSFKCDKYCLVSYWPTKLGVQEIENG